VRAALEAEFRIYRDRLQESLFEGKIGETEYARLLAEFRKARRE
jgi:CRISPR/Cas system-associated endoribonuclease Cas2